jgi:hypothetical protein
MNGKFENIVINDEYLRVGTCKCCGCKGVLVSSHKCNS